MYDSFFFSMAVRYKYGQEIRYPGELRHKHGCGITSLLMHHKEGHILIPVG